MQAVVKIDQRGGPEGTEVREAPRPDPGSGETRIKVLGAAICGSDRHIYHWDPSVRHLIVPPRIYGHEFCGQIDAVGPGVERDDLREGDYVSAEMHVTCGVCRACRAGRRHVCERTEIIGFHRDGTFAEFVAVPAQNVVKLAEDIPWKVGSFLDALGNAVHTVQDHTLEGSSVAVLGYGPIGAMATAIAHHERAARVYVLDVNPRALEQAERWRSHAGAESVTILRTGGEEAARATEQVLDETEGGVDLVLEMSGAPAAINQGLRVARMGGSVSLLGIPKSEAVTIERFSQDLIFKGLSVHAIIGRRIFSTWERMLELLAEGLDVAPLVSHEYEGLGHFIEGMEAFDNHEALKVVLYPHGMDGR